VHLVTRGVAVWLVAAGLAGGCARTGERAANARRDVALAPEVHVIEDQVGRGDTLASMLRVHDVTAAVVNDVTHAASGVFDLRHIRANQPYRLAEAKDGELTRFEYQIDDDQYLRVSKASTASDSDAPYQAELVQIPKVTRQEVVRGDIDRDAPSLVAAMNDAGETSELALKVADVLSGDIDFNTELQLGDSFRLIVDKQFLADAPAERTGGDAEGTATGYGPIEALEFVNAGHPVRALWFEPEHGDPGYYDEHGGSMRRFFLRSPLQFNPVVTSGFSRSRMHPILHVPRPHLGVDYRAPIGAPVIAVAAGVVTFAGANGEAGRMVRLRHANGYQTEYLHLSVVGVRRGQHVVQGDVIGKVGMTGLATGPHLDYRVIKNGVFVNPLTAQRSMPPAAPIPSADMAAFERARDQAFKTLDQAPSLATIQKPVLPASVD
jgi:murein DD-endopeptidase MepM/ murein hydrolase activator NlpD